MQNNSWFTSITLNTYTLWYLRIFLQQSFHYHKRSNNLACWNLDIYDQIGHVKQPCNGFSRIIQLLFNQNIVKAFAKYALTQNKQ